MKYYAKLSAKNKIDDATKRLLSRGALEDQILFDADNNQKQEGSKYMLLKANLLQSKEAVTFDTLTSLGKNSREIFKELNFFRNNDIRIYIADLDFTYDMSVDPMLALDKVFEKLADIENKNVKVGQKPGITKYLKEKGGANYGRQKLPYPDDWEQNYTLWRSGKISATEFMNRSGLKKGTFYNMIKEYKSENPEVISERA